MEAWEALVRAHGAQDLNVRMFGATGDGTTDDTAAIHAAIKTAGKGGNLYFPRGTYVFSDPDGDGVGLTQLSGQTWRGAGRASTRLLLSPSVTSLDVAIKTADFAENYSIEDMEIDGNRPNITPATDLYSTFSLVVGARGGKRAIYRNLILSNSWGRVLQTSGEQFTEYATDILVDGVTCINAGTKALSATQSRRVTITNCFAEVIPYRAADHPGALDAASGSCYECNDAHDVIISCNHGVQAEPTVKAPGIRVINGSKAIKVFGNTIEGARYLAFIQNCDDVDFSGNIGRNLRGNAILVADDDVSQPADTAKRVRIHRNTIIDPATAYVFVTAKKDGYNSFVEVYVYENDFIKTPAGALPEHGIYNEGVVAPATGGECLVYQWNNTFTADIPNHLSGPAASEIMGSPESA